MLSCSIKTKGADAVAFTTLSFVFAFLPLSILIFYAAPKQLKTLVLLLISLLFYTMLDPTNLLLMLLSITYDYLMAFLILKAKKDISMRKLPMMACVLKNMALVIVFGLQQEIFHIAMPLGLMVYSMTSMGYVIDVYRGDELFEKNWINFALFCTFFGKIITGPLVQYSDMRKDILQIKPSLTMISNGLILFVSGLAKQVILAGSATEILEMLHHVPQESMSIVSTWLMVLSFTFRLYFTLSGYCDMARGLAQIFSLRLPESYHYPFQSRTVSDFFNRFNITVTQFTNRYVYVILGGDTNGYLSTALNTLLTAMLLGLWFGIKLNYVLWGCYFAVLMLLERWLLMKIIIHLPVLFTRIYTFTMVLLSFTIFASDSLGQTWFWLKNMFGFGNSQWIDGYASYILSGNVVVLLLSFFFLTSLGSLILRELKKRSLFIHDIGMVFYNVGLLTLSVSLML